jgi:predicted phage baseplate assembly protein
MPLTEPNLDDRKFEQILADLRFRIPRYTKEWTNFNDSDPGMTLLQLFAWLSESMLFRMNQVPRKNYIKFLKLLGEELEPPEPAHAHLTFVTTGVTAPPVLARSQVSAQADDGGEALVFETEEDLDLISPPLDVVALFDGANFVNATAQNQVPGTKYKPFGAAPVAGNALYLGFVPPDPLPPMPQSFFPQKMTFRVFLPPEATAGKAQKAAGEAKPVVPPVKLTWEYRPKEGDPWQRLNVFEDETAAFTREGYIGVAGPQDIQPVLEARLNPKPRFWIRVRLESGRNYAAGRAPEIDFLRPNTVKALNLSTVRGEILGETEGHPKEQFTLQHRPVSSLEIQVLSPTGEEVVSSTGEVEQWKKVPDFFSSGKDDAVYRLNGDGGIVHFGDGDHGRIPEAGLQIVAKEYRYGGGARGNLAGAGKISNPLTNLIGVEKVTNERPAVGGSDEQTLDDILLKGPSILRRRDRAVTPEDFRSLVEEVGGIAHAKALPLFHPDHPGVEVPGALTVVVVPDNEDKPPKPSGELIAALCEMLDQKRLLTTEVFVKEPRYAEIRVEARVAANAYASFDSVVRDVLAALNQQLDPRHAEFGQDLSPTRLYNTILQVEKVTAVLALNIYVDGRRHTDDKEPITVPKDGLLFGNNHFITVEAATDK